MTTIELGQDISISKEDETIDASDEIIDPAVQSLAEGEPPVTVSPSKIATPVETPIVRRYYKLIFQTNPDHIPSMLYKKYETVNTHVECEEDFHPDDHMFSANN